MDSHICQQMADMGHPSHPVANLLQGLNVRAELVRDVEMKKRVRRETTVSARGMWSAR
jgi:hypothetical protein